MDIRDDAKGAIEKAHVGFKKLQGKLQASGKSTASAGAIAAAIGNKKYGEKKMHEASSEGKPLKESEAKKSQACEAHGEENCSKCMMAKSGEDVLKALTARMLSMKANKPVKVELDNNPVLHFREEVQGPVQAKQSHVHREYEPYHPPAVHVATPYQDGPTRTVDFMKSCNTCGMMHKSMGNCPRCSQVAAMGGEAKPYWSR